MYRVGSKICLTLIYAQKNPIKTTLVLKRVSILMFGIDFKTAYLRNNLLVNPAYQAVKTIFPIK